MSRRVQYIRRPVNTGTPAGDYDRRIIVQVKTETQSRSGDPQETWTDTLNLAAAFEALGSREFPVNEKRYAESTARFRIRYRPGIDSGTHRIIYGGRTWDIKPPLVTGRNVELQIEASEVV